MTNLLYRLMNPLYTLNPALHRIGSLCKRGHRWGGQDASLRYLKGPGVCVACLRESQGTPQGKECKRQADRKYKATLKCKAARQAAYRRRIADPQIKAARREYQREYARKLLATLEGRSANLEAQRKYRATSKGKEAQREKSHRRRATKAEVHAVSLTENQKLSRWAEFGYCCAYCGAAGQVSADHWIPISRGGSHVLGNLLPACQPCNSSKSNSDPESWYRSQPCFSTRRWNKIRRVLAFGGGCPAQIPLL